MDWDNIRKEYETTNISLKALAEKHRIKIGTMKSRKSREGWTRGSPKKDATKKEKVATQKDAKIDIPIEEEISLDNFLDDSGLTDKQRIFCLYYVRSFNATQAAINAGYSKVTAHVQGPRLLGNVRVKEEIQRLKQSMTNDLYIDAMDVLNKYVKIAFSDITDYLTFGQKWVPVMGMMGPILDDDGKQIMEEVNYVDFKESGVVDGTIISEVKQGRDGVSIKLEDRSKALDVLLKYFDLLPTSLKRKLEEEKLRAETAKVKSETKTEGNTSTQTVIVTGEDEMRRVLAAKKASENNGDS